MPGRTPTEAYAQFVEPIQRALNLITVGNFTVGRGAQSLRIDHPINASLNDGEPAPVRSSLLGQIELTVGIRFRITRIDVGINSYDCHLAEYWYAVTRADSEEILAFHWTPDVIGVERPYPHLHIGSTVSALGSIAPQRFRKLHIPTVFVPVEAIVRFAIEELGVEVRRGFDRAAVLADLASTLD